MHVANQTSSALFPGTIGDILTLRKNPPSLVTVAKLDPCLAGVLNKYKNKHVIDWFLLKQTY